ncbi:hypothetical protein [Methanocella sp. MCL-LM]|uniref:hypothetical protein n=1 Tax=Methanocella sp. MCL-LM TaxID=3412035 RepID=UPI003C77A105
MKFSATRITVSTLGALAGLSGIEHGLGEVLQGNVASPGIVFQSWPDSALFSILNGEPAMSIVPNLLVTGILAIIMSSIFLVWATVFIEKRHGGLVLILLSVAVLLVGGGFGPFILGLVIGLAATRINTRQPGWRNRIPAGLRQRLDSFWPWLYGTDLIAWLMLFVGWPLIGLLPGVAGSDAIVIPLCINIAAAFGLLLLLVAAGFVRDSRRLTEAGKTASGDRNDCIGRTENTNSS